MRPVSDLDRLRGEYANRATRLAGSDRYSVFNPAHLFMRQQTQRQTLALLKRHGLQTLTGCRVLELGCGEGGILTEYFGYGALVRDLFGVDLLLDRVQAARRHLNFPLTCADGQHLPYASDTFDLVLQYTAFSSVLDQPIRVRMANEMQRVLKQTRSLIIWYDFWLNPTNRHTRGIRPAEIRALFPDCQFEFRRVTLAPPIARRLVTVSWIGAQLLERLSLFNTHYLVAISRR
jgi:SAM-dependent methyltransferase